MSKATNFDRLAEEYDANVRCMACHEQRTKRGCRCSFDRLYDQDYQAVMTWWNSLPESDRNPKRGVKPVYAVLGTMAASRRRGALQDVPSRGNNRRSEADLERQSLQDELGIEPKWRKPSDRPKPTYRPSAGKKGATVLDRYIER